MKWSSTERERERERALRVRKIGKIAGSESIVPWWIWVLLAAGLFVALCPGVVEFLF